MSRTISRREFLQSLSSTVLWAVVPGGFPRLVGAEPAMPFEVGIVDAALGFSLIYEEYKGNYAEAQRLAERAIEEARRAGDAIRLADALRARGVVHLLQGEPGRALALFKELEALVPEDHVRVLWARTYAYAAFMLQYNTFPDGSTSDGEEAIHRLLPLGEYSGRRIEAADRLQGTRDRWASEFVQQLFWYAPLLRDFGDHERLMQAVKSEISLESIADSMRRAAEALSETRLLAYAALITADAYRRRGDQAQSLQFLAQAKALYHQESDRVGVAVTRMLEGDWFIAPFSTPAVLNFRLSVSSTASSDSGGSYDQADLDRSGLAPAKAHAAYREAEQLYRQAGERHAGSPPCNCGMATSPC